MLKWYLSEKTRVFSFECVKVPGYVCVYDGTKDISSGDVIGYNGIICVNIICVSICAMCISFSYWLSPC